MNFSLLKVTKQPNSNLFPVLCPRYLSVTAFSEQLLVGTSTLYGTYTSIFFNVAINVNATQLR